MTTAKPASGCRALRRPAALLAAGLLVAAGSQHAVAAASASGSGAQANATTTATPTAVASGATGAASHSGSAAASCPSRVRITLGRITVSNGVLSIAFTHTGHGCSSVGAALLHVHQNLLAAPRAGSDPAHQRNDDFTIGANHSDQVTVPLLQAVAGKCFVQVDAHAGGTARGQFFPTSSCPSPSQSSPAPSSSAPSSPASSSSAPSSSASSSSASSSSASSSSPAQSSSPPSSTVQTSAPPPSTSMAPSTSQSFLSASESRSSEVLTFVPVAQQSQPPSSGSLASTGASPAAPLGLAAVLLIAGAGLMYWARRPRRH